MRATMKTQDARGQAFPNHPKNNGKRTFITEADFSGHFEPHNIHGKYYSSYDYYFDARSDTLVRERARRFVANENLYYQGRCLATPLLSRPKEQFPDHEYLDRKRTLVHENTDAADALLKKLGRYRHIPHSGWYDHQVATSCVSASLHLISREAKVPFIPQDEIAEDIGVKVPYIAPDGKEYKDHRLVPDYVLALDRYCAIELDLGTETGRAGDDYFHRKKSYQRMVRQYGEFIARKQDNSLPLYYSKYNIQGRKPLLVLFLTTVKSKLDLMEGIILETLGPCGYILMQHLDPDLIDPYKSPKPLWHLWTTPWKRAGKSDFYLCNPDRQ